MYNCNLRYLRMRGAYTRRYYKLSGNSAISSVCVIRIFCSEHFGYSAAASISLISYEYIIPQFSHISSHYKEFYCRKLQNLYFQQCIISLIVHIQHISGAAQNRFCRCIRTASGNWIFVKVAQKLHETLFKILHCNRLV